MATLPSNNMETSQKNIRVMHYIGEFLNLDFASFGSVAEFLALIEALREGLMTVDEYFAVPDFHINMLFLSKLESHPDWTKWAKAMMQDKRLNAIDPAKQMKFHELAKLAMERENEMQNKIDDPQNSKPTKSDTDPSRNTSNGVKRPSHSKPHGLTQEEINAYVLRQMRKSAAKHQKSHNRHREREQKQTTEELKSPSQPTAPQQDQPHVNSTNAGTHANAINDVNTGPHAVNGVKGINSVNGHSKKPSQEEINNFVVRQMRKEQERKMRARSHSQPDLRNERSTNHRHPSSKTQSLPIRDKPQQPPQNLMTDLTSKKCQSCGERDHPGEPCRSPVAITAGIPRKDSLSKRGDIRTKVVEKTPTFRTRFACT